MATRKFGVYADDLPVFAWFREGAPSGGRAFEAEVMDWSDDVAYSVHDVEDAIASGRLDPRRLRDDDDVDGGPGRGRRRLRRPSSTTDDLGAALERVLATGTVPTAYDGSRRDLARA